MCLARKLRHVLLVLVLQRVNHRTGWQRLMDGVIGEIRRYSRLLRVTNRRGWVRAEWMHDWLQLLHIARLHGEWMGECGLVIARLRCSSISMAMVMAMREMLLRVLRRL